MDTYRATNTLNGKFYIGSSINFKQRKSQHLRSKENFPFQNDLRKNPEAFVWDLYVDDLDTNYHEVKLLKEFFFDVRCYNLNADGERPPDLTGRTRWKNELMQEERSCYKKPEGGGWEPGRLQKINNKNRAANSGENNPNFGVPRTEEVKKKISATSTGKTRTEEHKRRLSEANTGKTGEFSNTGKAILAIKPDGTELHFGSICEASRELGFSDSNLSGRYLKPGKVPKRGKFKGWQFFYENP